MPFHYRFNGALPLPLTDVLLFPQDTLSKEVLKLDSLLLYSTFYNEYFSLHE
jgi:hypothetical protein